MKVNRELKEETNYGVWRKLRKSDLARRGLIHCAMCPYHRVENAWSVRHDFRNWKNYREHQYKTKGCSNE